MRLSSATVLMTLVLALSPGLALAEAATEPAAAEAPVTVLPAITVTEVTARPMAERIIASGLIAPVEKVQVQPWIEGQPIESLLVDVGDMVEAGQVLAILSKSTLELQRAQSVAGLASARATIAQAEAQLQEAEASAAEAARVADRTKKLREQGSASQAASDTASSNAIAATARVNVARESLEAARAQLALSEAQLSNVDLQLGRTEVKAPHGGRVVERNATVGAVATAAGLPMFVLEKDGALELWADVAEADVLRLATGQPAKLTVVGMTEALHGTVRLVEPAIDTVTRLGRARIAIDGSLTLRAGMYVEAEIIAAARDTLAVPVTAIGSDDGKSAVMRVVGDRVERVFVTLGIRDGGWVEVASGLQTGDLVVTKAGSFVRAGDRINPVPDAALAAKEG